jgi:tetratricopeptide (TPR) repeat protein
MKQDIWLKTGVALIGAVLFLLLLFADKTNLNNQEVANLPAEATGASQTSTSPSLPPLSPDPKLDQWIAALEEASGKDQLPLLDSVIVNLAARRRFAYAADYAAKQVVALDRPTYRLRAGQLGQRALDLEYVSSDTALMRRYRDLTIEMLEPYVAENSESEDALLSLGLAYMRSPAPMQGIQSIRRVLEINPDNIEASYRLGEFSLQTGQFDKAISRFEKVLSIQPDNYAAAFRLGIALAQSGQADQARSYLQKVVANTPNPDLRKSAQDLLDQLSQ